MPCDSSHMEPTPVEIKCRQEAQFIVFVTKRLGLEPESDIVSDANNMYCSNRLLEPLLCNMINDLTEEELERIVYNGRDPVSRKLADWVDEHKKHDEKRERKEKELVQNALEKLTKKEIKALKTIWNKN